MSKCVFLSLIISLLSLNSIASNKSTKTNKMKETTKIGILIFPGVYQLDATAPYSVFASAENTEVHMIWKNKEPIKSGDGLILTPTRTYQECPELDVICIPGGGGLFHLLEDKETLSFIKRHSETCDYVTSVCTGSLLLAAAGGLDGYKATTHWYMQDLLEIFNIQFVRERVVTDRNRITSAGISAGIDMALTLVGMICGEAEAQKIELTMEYDPAPPFKSGHPSFAPDEVVDKFKHDQNGMHNERLKAITKAKNALEERLK